MRNHNRRFFSIFMYLVINLQFVCICGQDRSQKLSVGSASASPRGSPRGKHSKKAKKAKKVKEIPKNQQFVDPSGQTYQVVVGMDGNKSVVPISQIPSPPPVDDDAPPSYTPVVPSAPSAPSEGNVQPEGEGNGNGYNNGRQTTSGVGPVVTHGGPNVYQ